MTHTAKVLLSALGLSACYIAFVIVPTDRTARKRHELKQTLTDEKWLDAVARMSAKEIDTLHRFVFELLNQSKDLSDFQTKWTNPEFIKKNPAFIADVQALAKKYDLLPNQVQSTTATAADGIY